MGRRRSAGFRLTGGLGGGEDLKIEKFKIKSTRDWDVIRGRWREGKRLIIQRLPIERWGG